VTVDSPCIKVCRMDPHTGLCAGCYRSLDEIAEWGAAGDECRRLILAAVAQRRARFDDELRCNCEDGT